LFSIRRNLLLVCPMIAIKHLILAAFEPDAGPVPGELRCFIEREELAERLALPAGYRPVWLNPQQAILACATGVGAARAAASVMALGLDSRFDLSGAHVLITGVAGIDPAKGSLASVALPEFVVDGDLTHEIDAREIPAEWPDGFVPIGKSVPYEQPLASRFNGDDGILFQLNARSVTRAFQVASDVELLETPAIALRRLLFSPSATAQQPPCVLCGDELASSTFWHGQCLSRRAHRWVAYQSGERAHYTITAMEDAGILQSLKFLAAAGRVDFARVVIARAASNFDQQRDGITAAESLAETKVATDSAYVPALENAWRVGHALIESYR
jgi:purine nucleoside permease